MKLLELTEPKQDAPTDLPNDDQSLDDQSDESWDDSTEDQLDQLDQDAQDPNSMVKRYVKGAHLVYKRATETGSYEELWVYPSIDVKQDSTTRKAILSGTDIEPNSFKSKDGSQSVESWSAGNAQMLFITGLPN